MRTEIFRPVAPGKYPGIVLYSEIFQLTAQQAEKDGVSAMVIDLRTILPYDWDGIVRAVTKTNRVIIAHDDQLTWGFGAELAARIADELFAAADEILTLRALHDLDEDCLAARYRDTCRRHVDLDDHDRPGARRQAEVLLKEMGEAE